MRWSQFAGEPADRVGLQGIDGESHLFGAMASAAFEVRSSKPRWPGEMRDRPIRCLHEAHIGRSTTPLKKTRIASPRGTARSRLGHVTAGAFSTQLRDAHIVKTTGIAKYMRQKKQRARLAMN
jgi:hypothetical protein